MMDWYKRWVKKAETARELSRLDDRILRDIGVNRSDIPYVAEVCSKQNEAITTRMIAVGALSHV